MEVFELILIMLACVIASAILDQVITRVSLPLVQIGVGFVAAIALPEVAHIQMDPELFLVLFIAPLLFNEARESTKRELWTHGASILSLAIGLVLATVLVVGFALHWMVPSIPLAAAFACAAALGPTDAAAVGALGSTVKLSTRQKTLLQGESLINDASGVVSFQFAIAAAVTGAFSAADATLEFLVLFFGGIVAGAVMGLLAFGSIYVLRNRGFENTTVHVLYEVFTPFVVFLASEAIGVSGIIAVVVAGLVMSIRQPVLVSTTLARQHLVSSGFWEIIVFLINGVIFVLLGMQLPQALSPSLASVYPLPVLIGFMLVIAALVIGTRFVWVSVMELWHRDPETGERGIAHVAATVKDALVTTIAGPKGAVTLSIIFTIPLTAGGAPFPERELIILLAAGVILITLVVADVFLPILSPKPAESSASEAELQQATIKVLEATLAEMRAMMRNGDRPELEPAARLAIARTRSRVVATRLESEGCGEIIRQLIEETLAVQQARADEIQREGENSGNSPQVAATYYATLRGIRRSIGYSGSGVKVGGRFKSLHGSIALLRERINPRKLDSVEAEHVYYETCLFAIELEHVAIDYLEDVAARDSGPRGEAARSQAQVHRRALQNVLDRINFGQDTQLSAEQTRQHFDDSYDALPERERKNFAKQFRQAEMYANEVDSGALTIELEQIRRLLEAGEIEPDVARKLRENVYVMQMALEE